MADWPGFFREVRAICDASQDGSVVLTIDQIREGARSRDRNLNRHSWWKTMMNPKAQSHKGVLENGMECEALPERDPVERVVFRIREGSSQSGPESQSVRPEAPPIQGPMIVRGQPRSARARDGAVIMPKTPPISDQEAQIYANYAELFNKIDSNIWKSFISYLFQRDGGYKLAEALKRAFQPEQIVAPGSDSRQFVWEQLGWFFMTNSRHHEAISIYIGLYNHMALYQIKNSCYTHKGMPLVYISDCFERLGYRTHALRYIMYALCEDAAGFHGDVRSEDSGVYFRAVWIYGISDSLVREYTTKAYELHRTLGESGHFPERLLAELDTEYRWMLDFPSEREYNRYWANPHYIEYLLAQLGKSEGHSLERLGHYLLSMIPGCRTYRRVPTPSTDHDIVGSFEGPVLDFRSDLGRYFVCECKDWENKADFTTFAKLCRVLDSVKSSFGILFSKNGISGQYTERYAGREQIKVFSDRNIIIIVIDETDIRRVVGGESFLAILRSRYEAVRLDIAQSRCRGTGEPGSGT